MTEGAPESPGFAGTPEVPTSASLTRAAAPEASSPAADVLVRHIRRHGRVIAIVRAVGLADACVVAAEVFPEGAVEPSKLPPYPFGDWHRATAFVQEAAAAFLYLGCEVTDA